MSGRGRMVVSWLAVLWFCSGCGMRKQQALDPSQAAPRPIGTATCASCGMFVAEQPSPRAQAIHADGTRVYFCSIGDLLAYLPEPSRHGAVLAVFVEASDPDASDPLAQDTVERPWIRASEAWFVAPVPRERIMGVPMLVYRRRLDAERVARRYTGTRVFDWTELRSHPLHERNR